MTALRPSRSDGGELPSTSSSSSPKHRHPPHHSHHENGVITTSNYVTTRKPSLAVDSGGNDLSSEFPMPVEMNGVNGSSFNSINTSPTRALPGRARRKRPSGGAGGNTGTGNTKRKRSFWDRFYARWIKGVTLFPTTTATSSSMSSSYSLLVAIGLWYSLGVISIGSTKMLLMGQIPGRDSTNDNAASDHGIPPLFLTLQQQVVGACFLWRLLHVRFLGSSGLQPWPSTSAASTGHDPSSSSSRRSNYSVYARLKQQRDRSRTPSWEDLIRDRDLNLLTAGVYFCLGFLATNFGFGASSAAFVETVKAAEPITSAAVAVGWGIEVLSGPETGSLAAIVAGVALSTIANHRGQQIATKAPVSAADTIAACLIVMASNVCFSFRGLHQKLFRATPGGSAAVVDDLNLQFRMQQTGVALLALPVLFLDVPVLLGYARMAGSVLPSWEYIAFALLNGLAFTGYNLASTYILSRISVVHHAALNCIRRIFAIIVTSLFFGIPITVAGMAGILISFAGFMAFTHYKVQRKQHRHQRDVKSVPSLLPLSSVSN